MRARSVAGLKSLFCDRYVSEACRGAAVPAEDDWFLRPKPVVSNGEMGGSGAKCVGMAIVDEFRAGHGHVDRSMTGPSAVQTPSKAVAPQAFNGRSQKSDFKHRSDRADVDVLFDPPH
jgi:hypothetical protein